MKMLIIIAQDQDVHRLLHILVDKGYSTTKLASTGGFLREKNTTLLVGTEDNKVEEVLSMVKETCQAKKRIMEPISHLGEPLLAEPVEITVGGATVFVLPIEQFLKI